MSAGKSSAGPIGDLEIVITRWIKAPRELVWRAFSNAEHIVHWWGPYGFTTTSHAMDFRVGGNWRFTMHGPDGTNYPNLVLYTRIDPPARIEYDHGDGTDLPPHFRAVVQLDQDGAGTLVTLRLVFTSKEARDATARFGAVEGGSNTLERLEAYLPHLA